MMRAAVIVLAVAGAAACEVEPAVDATSQPIIGGTLHSGSPAVVMTLTRTGQCTGTLIGDRTVLTAGHCIEADIESGNNQGTVFFGSGDSDFRTRRVNQIRIHRYYSGFANFDIGMLKLAEDRPDDVDPIPFNLEPLPNIIGQEVRYVGFGVNDAANQSGGGVKRQAFLTVSSQGPQHIGIGDSLTNICQGDSGGPTLHFIDDVEHVIAVGSYGADLCRAESKVNRVDAHADIFVIPTYDAWEGPCRLDGACDPALECPRTPDPDCDACQLDGFCATDCPRVDLDCPLGGFGGALCDANDDCESRLCVEAPDDPRVKYCTQSCDPAAAAGDECALPFSECAQHGDAGAVCGFSGPSPSTQGASCTEGGDCRSGLCDNAHDICVEPCSGDGECGDEFSCEKVGEQRVCTVPRDGGGCSASGGAAGGASLLLVGAALAFVRRRRRA